MGGMRARKSREHLPDPTEINARDGDAYSYRGHDHQNIFGHAHPGDSSYAAHKNESAQQDDRDNHGLGAADRIETRYFYDDSESDELNEKVGNDKHDSYNGNKGG